MQLLIDKYIEAHILSWADSTLRSERSRLYAIASILDGDAEKLWNALIERHIGSYSRVTTFIRVISFYDWLIANGLFTKPNDYSDFQTRNRRLFKNCYQKQLPNCSYRDAMRIISGFSDSEVREAARLLLQTGVRVSEAFKIQDGAVVGKGGRRRAVHLSSNQKGLRFRSIYYRLQRTLKSSGLSCHMLRKICLSRVVELGATPFELCEIAGWASVNTAASYIQVNQSRIKDLMKQVQE